MKRPLAALALATMATLTTLAQEAPSPAADIAGILAGRIDRDQANVGMSVALIENGAPVFFSHGAPSVGDPTPVDEHTLFEAGSITKVMTNLLLARRVLAGEIDLDAPIATYLPPGTILPERDGKAITVFDLATHTAGLYDLPPAILEQGPDNPYSGYDAEMLMDWIAGYALPGPIGSRFEYSNVGAALLAQAIEHVTGRSFAELMQAEIFDPLGMAETRLALTTTPASPDMAVGHNAAREAVSNWDFEAFAPAGALVTSAADLARFIAAASGAVETPLAPAFALMLERTRPTGSDDETVGLGWFVLATEQSEIVWHNGITGGYRSFAGFDRETRRGVVVLSNMVTEAGIEDIGLHVLDPAQPLRPQPEPREVAEIDRAVLPAYAGEYLLAPRMVISITQEDGRLFAQITGQRRFEIFPESERRFFFRIVDAQITFGDPVDGSAPALMLHQNGRNMTAPRIQ